MASNTRDCFGAFVGQRLIGLLFDACPPSRRDIAAGTATMVFEDGRGLVFASNGAFWIESADDVRRALQASQDALTSIERDLRDVITLAGRPELTTTSSRISRGASGGTMPENDQAPPTPTEQEAIDALNQQAEDTKPADQGDGGGNDEKPADETTNLGQ
jgi:hypothetical protein